VWATGRARLEVPGEQSRDAVVVGQIARKQAPALGAVGTVPDAERLAGDRRRVQPRAARGEPPPCSRRPFPSRRRQEVIEGDARLGIPGAAALLDNDSGRKASDQIVLTECESLEELRQGTAAVWPTNRSV